MGDTRRLTVGVAADETGAGEQFETGQELVDWRGLLFLSPWVPMCVRVLACVINCFRVREGKVRPELSLSRSKGREEERNGGGGGVRKSDPLSSAPLPSALLPSAPLRSPLLHSLIGR